MILKSGTILINKDEIGLIYRDKYNDYSFPKGHVEEGETTLDCAIRETNEETKREVIILKDKPIYIESYNDSKGNNCVCEYFLARDNGHSDNTCEDTHDLIWTKFDDVYDKLSYESLKELWNSIKDEVKEYIEE